MLAHKGPTLVTGTNRARAHYGNRAVADCVVNRHKKITQMGMVHERRKLPSWIALLVSNVRRRIRERCQHRVGLTLDIRCARTIPRLSTQTPLYMQLQAVNV